MFSNLVDLKDLDLCLQRFYNKELKGRSESLADQVRIVSKTVTVKPLFDVTKFYFKTRKLRDLITLSIMSWYFPDEIRFTVQLFLEDYHWPSDTPYEIKKILLNSKEYSLAWLILQDQWNENDFFGNVLDKRFSNLFNKGFGFRKISRRKVKRYTGYCRGHPDSSRRGPRPLPPELLWTEEDQKKQDLKLDQRKLQLLLLKEKIDDFLAG
jgi:hypothetical protein